MSEKRKWYDRDPRELALLQTDEAFETPLQRQKRLETENIQLKIDLEALQNSFDDLHHQNKTLRQNKDDAMALRARIEELEEEVFDLRNQLPRSGDGIN
jgi:predicted RNase H-like nuclease (RuvC/YqgF family)